MTLEWLRRNDAALDRHLRTYLFTEDSVLKEEEEATSGTAPTAAPSASAICGPDRRPSAPSCQATGLLAR